MLLVPEIGICTRELGKVANITPIFMQGSGRGDLGNDKLARLMSILGKLVESIIKDKLLSTFCGRMSFVDGNMVPAKANPASLSSWRASTGIGAVQLTLYICNSSTGFLPHLPSARSLPNKPGIHEVHRTIQSTVFKYLKTETLLGSYQALWKLRCLHPASVNRNLGSMHENSQLLPLSCTLHAAQLSMAKL